MPPYASRLAQIAAVGATLVLVGWLGPAVAVAFLAGAVFSSAGAAE